MHKQNSHLHQALHQEGWPFYMAQGYQPKKCQQFDGKANPKQHVGNFIETWNNASMGDDLMIKQLV